MWKGVPDRSLVIAAVAGLFLLLEAGYSMISGRPNAEKSASDEAMFQLLSGGEGSSTGAVENARKALDLNPGSPQRWCDVAEALLEAGDQDRARRCFLRAEKLGPAIPETLLRAMYGAARQGREDDQVRLAHRVLGLVRTYDAAVYGLYLSSRRTLTESLNAGFPEAAGPSLLRHLAGEGDFQRSAEAWSWISTRRIADDALALEYSSALCRGGRRAEARSMWAGFTGGPATPLWNGGWETDRAAGLLDWELQAPGRGRIARDCRRAAEGKCSLRIDADWPESHFFEGVEQRVALPPGAYRLSAFMSVEGAAGFGLRAEGQGFDVRSAGLADTGGEWRSVAISFRARTAGEVRVQVFRNPGRADANVRGAVWVDGVTLEPERPLRAAR